MGKQKHKKLRSPVAWFGGKSRMVNKLIPMIPNHTIYVEPFGGGASMLLAKTPSEVEVYNDLNSGIVNFFRVLRDKNSFTELQRLASLTPYSREEFHKFREEWESEQDLTHKAHKWFCIARMSFSGMFAKSFGYSKKSSSRGMAQCVGSYLSAIDKLSEVYQRLIRVLIENKDALKLIKTFDDPETFFYLDPPYVHSTRSKTYYEHELTDDDHHKLVDLLLKLKGKVMLSGYANEIYERLEKEGWIRKDFDTVLVASGHTQNYNPAKRQKRVESVWMNYAI